MIMILSAPDRTGIPTRENREDPKEYVFSWKFRDCVFTLNARDVRYLSGDRQPPQLKETSLDRRRAAGKERPRHDSADPGSCREIPEYHRAD